jgi:ABC-2 type transport system permease protein
MPHDTRSQRAPVRNWGAVLRALWRVNVAEELQYRGNFVASVIGTLFWLAMALLTVGIFFRHTTRLGGWDFWEVVVLLGVFNALTGAIEAVLRPGVGRLAEDVRTGALDLVLVRPVDPQLYVSFRRLDIWRFMDVAMGLALAGYAMARLGHTPSVLEVLAFLIAMASAVAVVYAIWVALMCLAFWFVAVQNLSVLFDAVFEGARYPVTAYPGVLRFLFVYLVPIAWTTTIPASALTGRLRPAGALGAAVVAVIVLALTRLLWKAALSRYTSAGG